MTLIGIAIVHLIVVTYVALLIYPWLVAEHRVPNFEKIAILNTSLKDPRTLQVVVESHTDLNITLIGAIIKDTAGVTVTYAGSFPFAVTPTELPTNSRRTLTIDLNATLVSGTYTAILVTSKGNYFVSPTFTAP